MDGQSNTMFINRLQKTKKKVWNMFVLDINLTVVTLLLLKIIDLLWLLATFLHVYILTYFVRFRGGSNSNVCSLNL